MARWVSTQLELAELDPSRTRLMEAEVRALRAQISPHFIYNSLTAIASFVRTDPERARDLLLEFADFTRYSFRRHGEFTTLAEELRSIDRYLLLERARFGDRLQVTVQVAPEVLPVVGPVPVRAAAGRERRAARAGGQAPASGTIDDRRRGRGRGGADQRRGRRRRHRPGRGARGRWPASRDGDSVGLGNVDERLRQVFGDEYGLVVETAPGAGTKVSMRVPKYHPGVHALNPTPAGLRVLVVDDEAPALEELAYLLERADGGRQRADRRLAARRR